MANELMSDAVRRAVELVRAINLESTMNDTQMREFVNSSKDTIILTLANCGVSKLRREATLVVPAGTTVLTSSTTPALPDMIEPFRLWERAAVGSGWVQMRKVVDHIPANFQQATALIWWMWRGDGLEFGGATGDVTIKIHYDARHANMNMPSDTFDYPDLVNPVAFAAASKALGGNPYLDGLAQHDLDLIASIDSHAKQQTPIRLRRRRSGTRRY